MPLTPPFRLADRYDVAAEIGRGGHAVVYRAHDRVLDRAVAVKLLREDTMSADTLVRFRQEVQVMAQLEHAHILHLYDTGAHEGRPYVVMELASGRTLGERLRREGQLPVRDALEITRDVGLALAHAHAHGIVHRDVKPENVLLGASGAVLADFGIARVLQDGLGTAITSTGMAVGTVLYMSPEQLCAERDIDGRSDQYSLACVLYEMLAGVRPHIAATVEGLRVLRIRGEHAPVRSHRPSVPEGVDAALRVALSPMPADRFRSTAEFVGALDAAADVSPSGSYPRLGTAESARVHAATQRVRPLRPRTAVAAMVLAVTAVVGAIAWIGYGRASASPARVTGRRAVHVATSRGQRTDPALGAAVTQAIADELGSWSEVSVVDAVPSRDSTALALSVSAVPLGDSARIAVDVASGDGEPRRRVWVVPARAATATSTASMIVRYALGGAASEVAPGLDAMPGRSLAALTAYVHGWTLLRAGKLDSAQASFHAAAEASPGFAQASLWAAQSGAWSSPKSVEGWRSDAEATAQSTALSPLDSSLAAALRAMAIRDYPAACGAYRLVVQRDARNFAGWFGLGECQRLDSTLVHGPRGLQFRSSHWSALQAYKLAVSFGESPAMLDPLFDRAFRTAYAIGNVPRRGWLNTDAYLALPALDADSLAFTPEPQAAFQQTSGRAIPNSYLAATRRGRQLALALTSEWLRADTTSATAWYHRALALELAGAIAPALGADGAVGALARAAARDTSEEARARFALVRTRLALRLGDFSEAARSARNAIRLTPTSRNAQSSLAPLAAFVGDLAASERLAAADETQYGALPTPLAQAVHRFEVRAAVGRCAGLDSLRMSVERGLALHFSPAELNARRSEILQPIYRTAVPCLGPEILSGFKPVAPLDRAYAALARHDVIGARATLRALRSERSGASISAITWDFVFAEAWASTVARDGAFARAQIVDALNDIASVNANTLDLVPQAAGLRRAIELLRDAADSEPEARAWADRARDLLAARSEPPAP